MPPETSATIDLSVTMSPEAAAQQLATMQAAYSPSAPTTPTTSHDADVRLQQLISDPAWSRKLMAGDIATRATSFRGSLSVRPMVMSLAMPSQAG
jgi:hypothetical protein